MDSKNKYISTLAEELLEDIELSKLPAAALLLKTMRLARLADAPSETRSWLSYELAGYDDSEISTKYMSLMNRWINYEEKIGYFYPLAQVDANIEAAKLRLQSLRIPHISYSPSNPRNPSWADQVTVSAPVHKVLETAQNLQNTIGILNGIRARVLAYLHNFVVGIYHEKAFSGLSESIFEHYRNVVDAKLAERMSEVIEKIPSIYSRLAEGDREAISHALTTCRRIIDTAADVIYPPSDQLVELDGNKIDVGSNRHQNRLNIYIADRIESKSRKKRLRQTLSNLYDRVSSGVHNDVALEEAQSLFLQTYLYLGEILTVGETLDKPVESTVYNESTDSQYT